MSSGEISWDYFLEKVQEFVKISNKLNDFWTLEHKNGDPGNELPPQSPNISATEDPSEAQTTKGAGTGRTFEYHVVYSPAYSVPVLYFTISEVTGNLLRLQDVQDLFIQNLDANPLDLDFKTILTQMEHPVLFRPFLALHPCKTAEVLSRCPHSKNKVLTFISLFGPFVNLCLDVRYGNEYK